HESAIFIMYDEHGGFYDHASSPRAPQGRARTPDGISPGQCADLSNPPFSEKPGGGAECSSNFVSKTDTTTNDAAQLCPAFVQNPTGPYPEKCASFDQLGVRVPFMAVAVFQAALRFAHYRGSHVHAGVHREAFPQHGGRRGAAAG